MANRLINNPLLVDNVDQEMLASEVLERLRPELEAIPESELVRVNLDIPSGIALVLGALPEVTGLRPRIKAELPMFDLDAFDRMEEYAWALNAAHASYLAATEPSDELRRVLEEATLARETLVIDATALLQRGLLDARSVADLKGPIGHQNLATDLFHLVQAIRGRWPQVSSKSGVTSAELDRCPR